MAEKKTQGGTRTGAGRARIEKQLQIRRNISLSDRLADRAKAIGKNNVSEGIRIALEAYDI